MTKVIHIQMLHDKIHNLLEIIAHKDKFMVIPLHMNTQLLKNPAY